jgi:hypothetical protein
MPESRSDLRVTRISGLILHAAAICAACLFTTSFASAKTEQKPAPWVPPQTTLPKEFVEAVAFMLENGLEDPRGAKFLLASVRRSNQSDSSVTLVLGWLRADKKTLLSTTGQVYPVSSVKPKGDQTSVVVDAAPIRHVFGPQYRLKAAEMLILGDAKGAEEIYKKDHQSPNIFLDVTRDFLAIKFLAAVESHINGADKETLDEVRELQKLRPLYEAKAAEGMTEDEIRRRTQDAYPPVTKESRLYSFLSPIDAMGIDASRRLSQKKKLPDPEKIENQAERIAARILLLDQVNVQQRGQPGGVDLASDTRVRALIDEGDGAIEPLLKTLADDDRLTRSVSFWRDFFPLRNVISVAGAARAAIQSLLSVALTADTRAGEVEAYRSYWLKTKGLSMEERRMKELENESAGMQRWMDAARSLFMRTNSTKEGQWVRTVPTTLGEPEPKLKAEVLRKKVNPSLSELLARRSRRFLTAESKGVFDYYYSLHFSLYLYQWDPEVALPLLQTSVKATILESRRWGGQGNVDIIGPPLAQAVAARHKLGDKAAFQEWFDWIKTKEPIAGNDRGRSLYPLYALRNDPSVQKATDELFAGKGSKWNLRTLAKTDPYAIRHFAFSFFIGTQSVNEALIDILSDETEIATVSLRGSQMTIKFGNSSLGSSVSEEQRSKETHMPMIVGEQPVRVCDYVAYLIESLKGAPRVAPYWPKDDRNSALVKLREYIKNLPKDLNEVLPWPYDEEMSPYPY